MCGFGGKRRMDENLAATKIQSAYRGMRARKQVPAKYAVRV